MDITLLVHWGQLTWVLGSAVGLVVAFLRLWESLADLHAVRLGQVTNGRRQLALSGLAYDLALIVMFTGQFGASLSLYLLPFAPPDGWVLLRTIISEAGVWAVAAAFGYGRYVRPQIRRMIAKEEAP